jgi:hypothetical protein
MGSGGSAALERTAGRSSDAQGRVEPRTRPASPGELAWICAVPCAILVVLAIVVLGPPLGRLFPTSDVTFWPYVADVYEPPVPEATEHARYLLALTAPLVLTGVVVLELRRARLLQPGAIGGLVVGTQLALVLFLVTCFVVQWRYRFHLEGVEGGRTVYFTLPTLVVAGAIASMIGVGAASERVSRGFGWLLRESRRRRVVVSGAAVVAVAIWLLPAINVEGTIAAAHEYVLQHILYWLDETFAVLDGRFPLVDFAAQYGSLWPYLAGGAMTLLGPSVGSFTVAMSLITGAAMLAVFATLRRVVASTTAALLLFLPLLATSFFMMEGPLSHRYAVNNLFGSFPLRYAGPLLLLWLVARHLDGARPRRQRWLFLAAGLVVLNNTDFGVPALGATAAALVWSHGRPTRRGLARLALEAAIGFVGAYALVSVLTLAVAGTMPHLGLLVRYSRLFAVAGFRMIPMSPTLGVSTVIYLTYVAAIGVATVRAARQDADRLTTGLLAWSGIFGLGVGSYYMGRSHPQVLTNMFAAWALSVTLLVVVVVRAIAARPSRRPTLAEVACLFGFGLMVCSLAQTPLPWSEILRLRQAGDPIYAQGQGEPFVRLHTRSGEAVAIFPMLGHRTAYDLGITDVTPYTGTPSMPTIDQFEETLRALRAAGGRKVFLSGPNEWPGTFEALTARGYRLAARERYGMVEFVRPG